MCFQTRKTPAIIVGIMSGLVVILGLVMVFLSIRFSKAEVFDYEKGIVTDSKASNEISDFKTQVVIILLVTSFFAVLVGFCGLSLMCIRHRGCAVLFGCSLMPTWVAIFVLGTSLALFSNSSKSTIENFCVNADMRSQYISNSRSFVSNVDDLIGNIVTEKMCSSICPCADDDNKKAWLDMEETVLNTYGRTKKGWSSQGLVPLDFSGEGQNVYKTFE